MLIYLIIFFFLTLAVIIETFGDKVSSYLILFATLFFLLLITTFREGIGTDFYNYKEEYEAINLNNTFNVELGFMLLNLLAYQLGGFKILLLLTSTINLLSIGYILKQLKLNISIGMLTYYSIFYLNHNFNTIRHGLMVSIVWLSIYFYLHKNYLRSFLSFIISILFHQVAISIIPLLFFIKRKVNFLLSVTLFVILFIIGYIIQDVFSVLSLVYSGLDTRLEYYQNDLYFDGIVKYEFGLGFFLYIFIYFIILKNESRFDNKIVINFLNQLLFLGICLILIFSSTSILVERISNIFLVSIVFIFSSINHLRIKLYYKLILILLISIIDFFYLYKILHIPGFNREYQFIPYFFSF